MKLCVRGLVIVGMLVLAGCPSPTGGGDAENGDPVANAGGDTVVVVGQPAQLDGTGSSDPDGDDLTYAWSFVSVPDGALENDASIEDATSATTQFTPNTIGQYELNLEVTDAGGRSSSDTVTIEVVADEGMPATPSGPFPADDATDVSTDVVLSWNPSTGANSYDVYFGAGTLPATPASTAQSATTFTPRVLVTSQTYVWRIVANGDSGSVEGPEWSFTTQASDNADLDALVVREGGTPLTLSPVFNPSTLAYGATVGESTTEVEILATAIDGAASVSGDIGIRAVAPGSNVFSIVVTAESGVEQTYEVTVTRPSVARLSALSLGGATIESFTPSFSSTVYAYTAVAAVGTTNVTVSATPEIMGSTLSGDTGTQAVAPGVTNLTVTVTTADATASADYTIRVEIAPPAVSGTSASDGTRSDGVEITWNETTPDSDYRVYRRPASGGVYTQIGTTSGAESILDGSGAATSGVDQEYRVQAVVDGIAGAFGASDTGYSGNEVGITIVFDNPEDLDISITSGASLDRSIGQTMAVSVVPADADSYTWYLDGSTTYPGGANVGGGSAITVDSALIPALGVHTLTVVMEVDGRLYSADVTFTVEDLS